MRLAPLDALLILRERHGLSPADVESMTVSVPDDRVNIVRDREMPDVDLRHVLAVALIDGGMTFVLGLVATEQGSLRISVFADLDDSGDAANPPAPSPSRRARAAPSPTRGSSGHPRT